MRKIIVFEWITLDGFFAGANGEANWMLWGKEVEEYAKEVYATTDTVLFGRTTYQSMKNHCNGHHTDSDKTPCELHPAFKLTIE